MRLKSGHSVIIAFMLAYFASMVITVHGFALYGEGVELNPISRRAYSSMGILGFVISTSSTMAIGILAPMRLLRGDTRAASFFALAYLLVFGTVATSDTLGLLFGICLFPSAWVLFALVVFSVSIPLCVFRSPRIKPLRF